MNVFALGAAKPALAFAVLVAAALSSARAEEGATLSAGLGPAIHADTKLELDDCVARALSASAQIAASAAKTAAAAARLDFARSQYAPTLAFSGSYSYSSEVDPGTIFAGPYTFTMPGPRRDSWIFRLTLQQPLFTGFRIESGISQAKAALDAARAEERASSASVAAAARKAWWALYLADRSASAIEECAAAHRAHVAEARARLESGTGLELELLSARMREADMDALVSESRSALALARARLNALIGLPWDAPTCVAEPPEPKNADAPRDVAALFAKAKTSRPAIAAAAARVSMHKAAAATVRSRFLPDVYLTGSFSYADPNPKAFPQRAGFESLWDIGLMVSIDIGRIPATLAQAAEAGSAAEEAALGLAQLEDAIELEVVAAWLELSKCADRLSAVELSVELAESALRSQMDRFAAGLAVQSAVADAENDLLRAKLERTRARVSWELARISLRDAVGE